MVSNGNVDHHTLCSSERAPVREFFKDRRRMDGCTLLLLACVFMSGWVRSLVLKDEFVIGGEGPDATSLVRSQDQAIRFVYRVWSRTTGVHEEEMYYVPHVAIVLPLTLVSGYLLLIKPRAAKSAKESNRA
jgi:hypothetical protein